MDNWDEVCLVCGVANSTLDLDGLVGAVWTVMENLKTDGILPPSFLDSEGELRGAEEIRQRLTNAMEVAADVVSHRGSFFEDCLLVGHFHKSYKFDVPWRLERLPSDDKASDAKATSGGRFTRLILPGRGVQVRAGKGGNICGDFKLTAEDRQSFAAIPNDPDDRSPDDTAALDYLVHPPEAMRGFRHSARSTFKTSASPNSYLGSSSILQSYGAPWDGFGNFWVTEGCYEFVKAWVCLPPAENGLYEAKGEEPLTFEEEFYEVINSRKRGRRSGLGTMVEMKYEAMPLSSFDQAPHSVFYNWSTSVAKVLIENGDDTALVDALLSDGKCWLYCSPHFWPTKGKVKGRHSPSPVRTRVVVTLGSPIISLSMDTLETILKHFDDVRDYFALARTCTSLYNALQNPQRINQIFRAMAKHPSRCLFWVRPLRNELVEQQHSHDVGHSALRVLKDWCPEKNVQGKTGDAQPSQPCDAQAVMEAFDDPAFEWVPFVRACYLSDSMKNRRRIWKQVKQIEAMWRDYRLNGWQVNRFITKDQGIRAK